jgi:hypothetical protein
MKVYINKYKDHWISPYTMLDYVFFWTDWSKCARGWTLTDTLKNEADTIRGEKSRYVERPDWCDVWSDRLVPVSRAIQWIWDRIDRKIDYVKIDRWDTWSMDHTLGRIALPMLKQLKATKHGAPLVDDEDVPEHLRSTAAPPKENEYDTDGNHFRRWDWVMDEMIFAFEHKLDDSWEDAFRSGEHDIVWIPVDVHGNEVPKGEHRYYQMGHGPKDTYKCDYEGMAVVQKRIDNGFRLFGKYYQGLWD